MFCYNWLVLGCLRMFLITSTDRSIGGLCHTLNPDTATFCSLGVTPQSDQEGDTYKSKSRSLQAPTRNLPPSARESCSLKILVREARNLPMTSSDIHDQEYFVCASIFHRLTQLEYISHRVDNTLDSVVRVLAMLTVFESWLYCIIYV
jgi:hypothetical protein